MSESVPVRCPACRREHVYASPTYPCACGAPVAPVLDRRALAESVTHHTWDEGWVTIRCASCGREDQWPRPEVGCPCGTVLRVPVTEAGPGGRGEGSDPAARPAAPDAPRARGTDVPAAHDAPRSSTTDGPGGPDRGNGGEGGDGTETGDAPETAREGAGHPSPRPRPRRLPAAIPLPRTEPAPRPAFQPVTIRTARDAVTAAALYLRWLGYRDIRRADQRPPSGIGLAARGIVAQVDPTVRPASLRDVECLWLTAMTESAGCVYFSLAGYEDAARACADSLGIPLFVLDLTGTPQAANSLADELVETGA
ncbi:hypothetical protein ACFUTV_09240 [Streptomyces sp. NPDC057298]|uniref:hypothetical protein n=1 Tax=Streptomyces sp. NPDC057298 TaxID=3346091 RepID=UPI00362E37B6